MAQDIEIKVSGRIGKYFFGTLREEFQEEIDSIVGDCTDGIEDEQDFLRKVLELTLEGNEEPRANFHDEVIGQDALESYPNFKSLIDRIVEEDLNHFNLFDELFFTAERGFDFVNFFDCDAQIEITVDGEQTINTSLGEFYEDEGEGGGHTEDEELTSTIADIVEKNPELDIYTDYVGWKRNKQGYLFADPAMAPESMERLAYSDYGVTVFLDDITTFTYSIGSEGEFDPNDVAFLKFQYADDFTGGVETVFNYVFYKGEMLHPDEDWSRDKGITLNYNPDESMEFLLNG